MKTNCTVLYSTVQQIAQCCHRQFYSTTQLLLFNYKYMKLFISSVCCIYLVKGQLVGKNYKTQKSQKALIGYLTFVEKFVNCNTLTLSLSMTESQIKVCIFFALLCNSFLRRCVFLIGWCHFVVVSLVSLCRARGLLRIIRVTISGYEQQTF